jgi:hypothetical protein
MECRTEHIHRVIIKSHSTLPQFSTNHVLHPELLRNTQYHIEALARVGLTKPSVEQTLEYFSMLRSGADMHSVYSDYD